MFALTILAVPFSPQSDQLCGGAAAAMVLRYWGEREVHAEDFAALSELFRTLEDAQRQSAQETSSRLAQAGLTAAEAHARLHEVQALRQALGELN